MRPSSRASIPLLLVLLSGVGGPLLAQPAELPLDRALKAIHLNRADLLIDADFMPGPGAPGLLRKSLEDPLRAPLLVDAVAGNIERDPSIRAALRAAAGLIDLSWAEPPANPTIPDAAEALVRLWKAEGREPPARTVLAWREALAPMPGAARHGLAILIDGVAGARRQVRRAFRGRTAQELSELIRVQGLLRETLPEGETRRIVALASRVDRGMLASAMELLLTATESAAKVIGDDAGSASSGRFPSPAADGDVLGVFETPAGPVIVGGAGRTIYRETAAVILDLGGNDVYEGGAGGARGPAIPVSVCLDLGGDDRYAASEGVTQGAGFLGVGLLMDVSGSDAYECSGDGCQGFGIAGFGMLADLEGDDRYAGGIGCQGAGLYGGGILVDGGGTDRYEARARSQGYGGAGGVGALIDRGGNDLYVAPGDAPDFREEGHRQSMAQGYGTGLRPFAAGGAGLLLDADGNDRYEADYFAQGSGYWTGCGLLLDRRGRDSYAARRYAQGSASHVALGILADGDGDDRYRSWGVSQGCGHDLSLGWLLDLAGDDSYEASWLSQGAGSSNGVGFLVDRSGDDHYVGERNVRGSGTEDRGFVSIGVFLDGGGRDRHTPPRDDGTMWTDGERGVGLDTEASPLW